MAWIRLCGLCGGVVFYAYRTVDRDISAYVCAHCDLPHVRDGCVTCNRLFPPGAEPAHAY